MHRLWELQEAEKGAQIQIVFVDGGLGVALYHLMILEKIPEDLRRFIPIIHLQLLSNPIIPP